MKDKAKMLNGAALAYIGDAIYEVAVREYLIGLGETNPNKLHKQAVHYVGAAGQAKVMKEWISHDDFLNEEEITMYKRGRNNKANTKAKNASIGDYRQATGFESLIGWLYLSGQTDRLNELQNAAIQYINQSKEVQA